MSFINVYCAITSQIPLPFWTLILIYLLLWQTDCSVAWCQTACHLFSCICYCCWIVFVDVFEDCDQYDLTTDADFDDADNDRHINKRKHKRKSDHDFVRPSEGMKSLCLFAGLVWYISAV